jgi:Holliday junction resolvase-like predicted endonuclease
MCYLRDAHQAEMYVARLLLQAQWKIVAQNFRRRGCEIDLVAQKAHSLVFIEVKLRTSFKGLCDYEALLPLPKRQALMRGRDAFVAQYTEPYSYERFDLVVVGRKGQVDYFTHIL